MLDILGHAGNAANGAGMLENDAAFIGKPLTPLTFAKVRGVFDEGKEPVRVCCADHPTDHLRDASACVRGDVR